MRVFLKDLLRASEDESALGLCTLLDVRGSSPQVCGASALFSSQGVLAGTVGGGFVEESCRRVVDDIMAKGGSRLICCDLDGTYHQEGAAVCGGRAKVLIDGGVHRHMQTFRDILSSLEKREAGVLLTFGGEKEERTLTLERHWIPFSAMTENTALRFEWPSGIPRLEAIGARPRFIEGRENSWVFAQPLYPAPRLLIFGGGHVGHAVAKMGEMLEFEVMVVDNREAFSSRERFPDVSSLHIENYTRLPDSLQPAPDTFVVIVTQGHRHDAEVLRHYIRSEAAYLGMIGSRRKIRTVRAESLEKGWASASQWEKVHAPIGLDIGAESVAEIGVSIAAELVQARRAFEQRRTQAL